MKLLLMPLYKGYRAVAQCTIRNPRGKRVAIGTDGRSIFVEADFEDLRTLDVETEVRLEQSPLPARITVTEYWDNDPPRTTSWDVIVGLELVEVGTPVLESES